MDRRTWPRQWLRAVYRPFAPLITQIADGEVPVDGPTSRRPCTIAAEAFLYAS
ncbi:hypothetical protein ACWGJ2_19770 [Streptomyces sp. NPDC054796]